MKKQKGLGRGLEALLGGSPDFIEEALSPAKIINIKINEQDKTAVVEVAEDQQSLAIGKGGQNVRLAAKLTGWRIDIKGMEATSTTNADELSEDDILDGGIVDDGTDDK